MRVNATFKVSYSILKDLLKLPDDVELLGVIGAYDKDNSISVIVETPTKYIIQKPERSAVFIRR